MSQTKVFLENEGDNWFSRNMDFLCERIPSKDLLFISARKYLQNLSQKHILEVGCSNGYRLSWIKNLGAYVKGFDPSLKAVLDGWSRFGFSSEEIVKSDALSYFRHNTEKYDAIIFGHSIYLMQPKDLPEIIFRTIDCLKDNGMIFIYDFDSKPQRRKYHHKDGCYTYKSQCDRYFTWFPQMYLVHKEIMQHNGDFSIGDPQEDCALSVIKKISIEHAYTELV